jgi:hypothetical protein
VDWPVLFLDVGSDHQILARLQKPAELDISGFLQHDHRVGEIVGLTHQPMGRLVQGFEHQHARHDREIGEVILQIALGSR